MSAQEILHEIQTLGGRLEVRGERLHIELPAGSATPELKERIRANKPALLAVLSSHRTTDDLTESLKRLESANILLAISEDGDLRIVLTEAAGHQAIRDGYSMYEPSDAYHYVQLDPDERRMLREWKLQASKWQRRKVRHG
jgi:hypothetical protein